jgi:hypothetical protein
MKTPSNDKERERIPGDLQVWFTLLAGLIVMIVSLWVAMRLMGWN